MTDVAKHEAAKGWTRASRVARWIASAAIALSASVYAIGSTIHSGWHDCSTETTKDAAATKVVVSCRAIGPDRLIPLGILIAILLAPDLSELAIPGLITLKRRLEETDKKQEQLERRVADVRNEVRQSISFTIATVDPGRILADVHGKESEFLAREGLPELPAVDEPTNEPESSSALKQLLQRAAEVERYKQLQVLGTGTTTRQLETVRRWSETFGREIAVVQRFRTALANDPSSATEGEVASALQLADRLIRLIETALGYIQ